MRVERPEPYIPQSSKLTESASLTSTLHVRYLKVPTVHYLYVRRDLRIYDGFIQVRYGNRYLHIATLCITQSFPSKNVLQLSRKYMYSPFTTAPTTAPPPRNKTHPTASNSSSSSSSSTPTILHSKSNHGQRLSNLQIATEA